MMNNLRLPQQRLLFSYWLSCETTNTFACPSLQDIAFYKFKDGKPQTNVVGLFAGKFNDTPDKFELPYIKLPESIQNVLTNGDVQYLQNQGIKVVLSILGDSSQPNGIGWSCIPENKNSEFSTWVQSELIEKYNLDGIDIDDEFSNCARSTQNLMKTVTVVREALPDKIISKALWQDEQDFQGTNLAEILTCGSTMSYGYSIEQIQSSVEQYKNWGLPYTKICIGVQAGPPYQDWMTSLEATKKLTEWAVANNLLGMMLFSFSQDIQQFTHSPQHQKSYPSPDDHQWQEEIIKTMWTSEELH